MRKKESLPFATMWMGLEDIVLSTISETKTNALLTHLHVALKYQTQKMRFDLWFPEGGVGGRRPEGGSGKAVHNMVNTAVCRRGKVPRESLLRILITRRKSFPSLFIVSVGDDGG